MTGTWVIAADSSGAAALSVQEAIAGDLDGSHFLDMAHITEDSLLVYLDPAGPGSSILTVEVSTDQMKGEGDPSRIRIALRALSP